MIRTLLTAAAGAAAGYAATKVKGNAEGVIQPRAEAVWPLTPEQRLIPGADQANHGELMPPTVVVKRVLSALGRPAADGEDVEKYAAPVHFGTGIVAGAGYALLRRRVPLISSGLGVPAGLGLYGMTHGSLLPAAGIQPFPWQNPPASVAWEAGSHVVYGVVLETLLRVVDTVTLGLLGARR